MDAGTFMLLDKLRQQEPVTWEDVKLAFIVLPLIGMLIKQIPTWIQDMTSWTRCKISYPFSSKNEQFELLGHESLNNGMMVFEYPETLLAMNNWLFRHKKVNKYRLFNESRNGDVYQDEIKRSLQKEQCVYIADCCPKTKISNDIFIEITRTEVETSASKNTSTGGFWKFSVTLTSSKPSLLEPFINMVLNEFREIKRKKDQNKLYHFIYQGNPIEYDCSFSTAVLSDVVENPNMETFEHLINEHTEELMDSVIMLRDIEYYRKNGLKRKKGWLFHGYPGCGKTASVMAISNMDQRHIIEIPLSRVKSNKELEKLLRLSKINEIDISPDKVIYLFDEIDREMTGQTITESIQEEEQKGASNVLVIPSLSTKKDELSIGSILSRLDGIGNYNGLIIIATTNNKDNLDPALYRDLRLTPVFFQHLRQEDSIKIIEKFYERKLTPQEIMCIPDQKGNLSPARLRVLLEKYRRDISLLLNELKTYCS